VQHHAARHIHQQCPPLVHRQQQQPRGREGQVLEVARGLPGRVVASDDARSSTVTRLPADENSCVPRRSRMLPPR